MTVETHDSGEYRYVRGKIQRNRERITVRGLNDNHNKGMRPTMARLTLARKIASITLTRWKKGASFDPKQLQRQAA